jgi:hypothetical protein
MTMRCFALAALLAMQAARADIWVSTCTARDLQYNQTIGGKGIVHIGNGDGTYQSVRLTQTFYDGTSVCGTTDTGQQEPFIPLAEICASRSRDSIYVLTKPAKGKDQSGAMTETPFCRAQITVLEDKPSH